MSENTPSKRIRPPSTPDKFPPSAAFFSEIIDVTVGTGANARIFRMYKDVLCFYSGYFTAALNGNSPEAKNKAIELQTEELDVFRRVAYWMHIRRLDESSVTTCEKTDSDRDKTEHKELVRLWIFGGAHQIPLLQNEVLNFIHKKATDERHLPLRGLNYAYEHSTPDAKLRHYMIKVMASTSGSVVLLKPEWTHYWSKDSLIDLGRILWGDDFKRPAEEVKQWDMCEYHVHEEEMKCGNI